jgi:hypothetical protein
MTGAAAAVPDAFLGDLDPADLLQVASDNALEGMVAKRLTCPPRCPWPGWPEPTTSSAAIRPSP